MRIAFAALLGLSACWMQGMSGDEKAFRAALGNTGITVFPAVVRTPQGVSWDRQSAVDVAAFFSARGLATAVVSEQNVPLSSKTSFNQARMFRASEAAFRAWLKDHPVSTPYALVLEYLVSGNGRVGGIHCYVLGAGGERAFVLLLNSHYKEFRAIDPKSPADASRVALARLKSELAPPK